MSRAPYGVSTAEERDTVADDRDEAAQRRDRAGAVRDIAAGERDQLAQDRMWAAIRYATLVRRLLVATSQRDGQQASPALLTARGLLGRLDEALQDFEVARGAAVQDRRAAAVDRRESAEDRFIVAGHRGQAAIERAQRTAGHANADEGRGEELCASARSARAQAAASCQRAREFNEAGAWKKGALRQSELARLRARLDSMPVIEQAKGIIMAQNRCGPDEAFTLLRQASQRLNEPVRDLCARIVASASHLPASRADRSGLNGYS